MTDTATQENDIRQKRMETLVGIWSHLIKVEILNGKSLKLSPELCNEVVEFYLSDYRIIKLRYKINDRIQVHKIAGLMTCAIIRRRPIIPIDDAYTSKCDLYANELLAVFNGV